MKNSAIITLNGTITEVDGELETFEFVTEGVIYEKDNKIYISYEENESAGWENVKTLIKLLPDKIILSRTHGINMEMVFIEGTHTTSYYETPLGGLTIGVDTSVSKYQICDDGRQIDIHIKYNSDFNGKTATQHEMRYRVRRN